MYLKFYNLNVKPFEISPDPKFLWVGDKHKEGFAALKYAILTGKGFISLTGDVGTGKTTLLNALAISVDDKYIFARIPDPSLDQLDFFNIAASAFAMNKRFDGKGDFLRELSTFLIDSYTNNKEAVLIIDEAQRIKPELLEEIRLISNIEKPEKKLLTIIFAGQPSFNQILINNRALRNRLAFNYIIEPLTEIETEKYISHRLNVAGSKSRIFSSSAIHEIYSFSKGNPRQINIICDLALLYGYSVEAGKIEPAIIRECVKRTSVSSAGVEPLPEQRENSKKIFRKPIQEKPAENSSGSWKRPIPAIKTTVSRHKTAYLSLIPLIVLVAIIGFIYYGGSSNSSILKMRAFIEQAKNSYAKPVVDAFLQNAQVVKVPVPKPTEKRPIETQKNPDRERNSQDRLGRELPAQTALIADLQKKLHASQTDQAVMAGKVAEGRQTAALLKGQLEELAAQKQASENRLENLRTAHNALAAEFEELKQKREQVNDLENALAAKDRVLAQSAQRLQEQEKNLVQLKDAKNKLDNEFSAQAALVADLQKRLQASQTDQAETAGQAAEVRQTAVLLKGQLKELTSQKQAAESRFESLQTAYNALTAEFEELKHKRDQDAELENALAAKDRMLAQSEQHRQELEKILAQLKEEQSKAAKDFAAQAALIADLQKRLQTYQVDQEGMAGQREEDRKAAVLLKGQLEALTAQKQAAEKRFEDLQTSHIALKAEFEDLKHNGERIGELENALAQKGRQLEQSEQRQQELENVLAQVKNGKSKLDNELAAQAGLIADLQKRLQASQADQAALKDEYNKSREQTAQLQAQVEALTAKISASQKKTTGFEALSKSEPGIQPAEEASKSQNPGDVIDWVLKKKSQ